MSEETRRKVSNSYRKTYENGHIPWNKGKQISSSIIEKARKSILNYAQKHDISNKGLSWSHEIRDKIRQGCLNSEIRMSPKAGTVQEELEEMRFLV